MNLLEFDHRIDRPQQHDVAMLRASTAGGQFLRRGQDGRDRLFVVLEIAQVLLAQVAVVGGDPLAVSFGSVLPSVG